MSMTLKLTAKYTIKKFNQRFVDYLGPVMYLLIIFEYKKSIFDYSTLNSYSIKYIKKTVKTWLLSEFV